MIYLHKMMGHQAIDGIHHHIHICNYHVCWYRFVRILHYFVCTHQDLTNKFQKSIINQKGQNTSSFIQTHKELFSWYTLFFMLLKLGSVFNYIRTSFHFLMSLILTIILHDLCLEKFSQYSLQAKRLEPLCISLNAQWLQML